MNKKTPLILVAFGITGDLMRHKILPALFSLYERGELSELVRIIGVSRKTWDTKRLQQYVTEVLKTVFPTKEISNAFLDLLYFQQGDVEQQNDSFDQVLSTKEPCNILLYLSIAPELFESTLHFLSYTSAVQKKNNVWTKIIIEKPFGYDGPSAKTLNQHLQTLFTEEQIFRADHYLQKPFIRNLVTFRKNHPALESLWNHTHIRHIQVRLWETYGIRERGVFYDHTGALRDVGQNHLLQILAMATMELPHNAEGIPIYRAHLLNQLSLLTPSAIQKQTYRAQCDLYHTDIGKPSNTETYFSLTAEIHSPRWSGVSIHLDGGKYLPRSEKYIQVTFLHPEPLEISQGIQDVQKVRLEWDTQKISYLTTENTILSSTWPIPHQYTDYEHILMESIAGNKIFFVSTEEIDAAWHFVDPIIESWSQGIPPLQKYRTGQEPESLIED